MVRLDGREHSIPCTSPVILPRCAGLGVVVCGAPHGPESLALNRVVHLATLVVGHLGCIFRVQAGRPFATVDAAPAGRRLMLGSTFTPGAVLLSATDSFRPATQSPPFALQHSLKFALPFDLQHGLHGSCLILSNTFVLSQFGALALEALALGRLLVGGLWLWGRLLVAFFVACASGSLLQRAD